MLSLHEYIYEVVNFTPQIDETRCVHSKIEVSTCTSCVDICPYSALILNDESLSVNVSVCIGCALCVAACPEVAIEYQYQHKTADYKGLKANFLACQYANYLAAEDKNIFCINAVTTFELLNLYTSGTKLFFLSTGSCNHCKYNCIDDFKSKIKNINYLLSSRAYNNIKFVNIDGKKFKTLLKKLPNFNKKNNRRIFLRNMFAGTVNLTTKQQNNHESINMAKLLPVNKNIKADNYIYPCVPQIDEFKCDLCNACIRLCPHQSLVLEEHQINLLAATCTGCNICVDVCKQQAISIKLWHKAKKHTIKITTYSCVSCGVSFSIPSASDLNTDYCSICTHNNNNKNLYQIVDA